LPLVGSHGFSPIGHCVAASSLRLQIMAFMAVSATIGRGGDQTRWNLPQSSTPAQVKGVCVGVSLTVWVRASTRAWVHYIWRVDARAAVATMAEEATRGGNTPERGRSLDWLLPIAVNRSIRK
jgi:hypothetical protein